MNIEMSLLKLANLTVPSNKNNLKENFAVHAKYEAFYTGGHVQLSEDGHHLFCACGSKVQVLDTGTGKMIYSVRKDDDGDDVTAFAVDQKGDILVISYRSGLLRQWQWKTETVTRTWKSIHSGPIRCMAFDPTSALLATGGSDSTVKVWDLNKLYCTHNLKGATGVFTVVQFHLESSQLQVFGAADDYKIHVWDLTTGRHVSILEGHFSAVTQLAFTANGKTLFSSGRDNVVLVWNLEKLSLQKTIPVYETLESVMLIPEGRLIPKLNVNTKDLHVLTAGNKGILKVWNVSTGTQVFAQEDSLVSRNECETSVIAMASYNAALDVVMVVTHEHNILMYKLEDFSKHKQLIGYNDDILDVRFFGEGDTHLVVATNSPIIKVFELATYNCQLLTGHTDLVLAVDVFSSKPSCMVSASKDNTVKFWSIMPDTGEVNCLFTGQGHTHSVTAVSCSSLGNGFLVSGSEDTTLKIWDIPQKAPLVLANPSLIVRCTQRAHDKEINTVAVAPNDKLLVSGSQDKTAKVWRCDDLTLIGVVRGHRKGVWCVQFSPIDQVFATSSADGTVKIWALNNLSCVKTFEGHECSVMKLLFLSRGMQLLTGGSDGNVKLWNIKLNECTRTLDEHTDKVWAMAISKDENFLVTGSADSKIILWKDVTDEEKEKQHLELESVLEKDQELSNLIQHKNWLKALSLAITLDRPFKALNVIKEILTQQNGAEDMVKTIKQMRQDQIDSLLKFASTWNTNSKHCTAAQLVVRSVLTMFTPEKLMKFPTTRQFVEDLLPYTERHMQRMNRLLQQAYFVNYMWRTMKVASSNIQYRSAAETDKDLGVDERIDKYNDEMSGIDVNQETAGKSSPFSKEDVGTGTIEEGKKRPITGESPTPELFSVKPTDKAHAEIIMTGSDSESDSHPEDSVQKFSSINKSLVNSKAEISKTKESPLNEFPTFQTSIDASTEMNIVDSGNESDCNPKHSERTISPFIESSAIYKKDTSSVKQNPLKVFPIVQTPVKACTEMNVTDTDSESDDNPKDSVPKDSSLKRSPLNSKIEIYKTKKSPLKMLPAVQFPVEACTETNVKDRGSESDDNPKDSVLKSSPLTRSPLITKPETTKIKESPLKVLPLVQTPVEASAKMIVIDSINNGNSDHSEHENSPFIKSPLSGETVLLKRKKNPSKVFSTIKAKVKASTDSDATNSESDDNQEVATHKISPFIKSPVISKEAALKTKPSPLKVIPIIKATVKATMNITESESDSDQEGAEDKMALSSKSLVVSRKNILQFKESPTKRLSMDEAKDKEVTEKSMTNSDMETDEDQRNATFKISPVTKGPVKTPKVSRKMQVFGKTKEKAKVDITVMDNENNRIDDQKEPTHQSFPTRRSVRNARRVQHLSSTRQEDSVQGLDVENETDEDSGSNAEVTSPVRVTRGRVVKKMRTPQKAIPQQTHASTAKKTPKSVVTRSPAKRSNLRDTREMPAKENSSIRKRPVRTREKNLNVEDVKDCSDELVKTQITPAKKNLPNRKRPVRTCVKKVSDAKKRLTM